ncbi:MAG TPA: response regulator [Candidatus Saccharimonadales bacterium]|nr:response regulator [Candidatus Saccharimonadales bacterium]
MNKQTGSPESVVGAERQILVADDDPAIVDAIKIVLEDEGYRVTTTVNGETVKKIRQDFPDLILLDIWMSGMDGRDITRYLKNQAATRHIPVIMISANRDTEQIALAAGADGFLAKPFDIKDLIELVQKHLSSHDGGGHVTS